MSINETTITSDADHAALKVGLTGSGNVTLEISGDNFASIFLGPRAVVQLLTTLTDLTDEPAEPLPMLWATKTNGVTDHE